MHLKQTAKNRNIRDLYTSRNEFKTGYQSRTNLIKEEKDDQLADSHSVLNRWRNHFCQLLNVQGDNDVRQTAIHTAEPLVPEPSTSEVEMATEMLRQNYQVLTKLQQN
jgi:hypothetical protein